MKRLAVIPLLSLFLLWLTFGCTTQKNNVATRFYHELTSHYNLYFNANESMKEGILRVKRSMAEDFTRILPVFPEDNQVAMQSAAPQMELAVQKCLKLIASHSITVSPTRKSNDSEKYKEFASRGEYNNWIDDTYLLMGEANYYLHDLHKAVENFNFILHNFSTQPTRNPAFLWLARCYLVTGEQEKALEIFQLLERDGTLPEKVKRDLSLVKAGYFIGKEQWKEAIPQLKQALRYDMPSDDRGRYNFILAQLCRQTGDADGASEAFKRVIKAKPPYRMVFEAKISLLEMTQGNDGSGDQTLTRMIHNGNNKPYLDRIYFARAERALQSGKKEQAIADFRTSVAASADNNSQRAASSLALARLYFEESNYRMASCYYDTALSVIDPGYPDYETIVSRTNGLLSLVRNLDVVGREDSLQRIAALPEKERTDYIGKLIAKVVADEEQKARNDLRESNDRNFFRGERYRNNLVNTGDNNLWYFYNPVTVGLGKTEFQQLWGKRRLEDNWRRKNKISLNISDMEGFDNGGELVAKENQKPKESNPKAVEYYMQNLPLSDSLLRASHDRIKSALFAAGRIYESTLKDEYHAIAIFEELNVRYPASLFELPSWIELHKMKQDQLYRQKITSKYPESNYAKYLMNPNFLKDLEQNRILRERKYSEAIDRYKKGDYQQAGTLAAEVLALQPDSLMLPKVRYIRMIAEGQSQPRNTFEKQLESYLHDYPTSPMNDRVLKIRELVQQNALADLEKTIARLDSAAAVRLKEQQLAGKEDPFGGKFSYDEELFHYFVLSFPITAKVDVNRLIFDLANFNIDYYTSFDFDIEEIKLNDQIRLVVVRSLPDKQEGLGYFGTLIKHPSVLKALKGVDYHYFVTSSTNYRKILADQDIMDYLRFFVLNYSKNSAPLNP